MYNSTIMSFRFLTSGESHGKCLNAIIEGIPAGFEISEEDINKYLAARQIGYGRGGRMQIEKDKAYIKSGIRFGKTTGAPISLEIINKDWENWQIPMSIASVDLSNDEIKQKIEEKIIKNIRPGHADLSGAIKYNHDDIRNILERSSARETATRVAVGAIAAKFLSNFGIKIFSHVIQIGLIQAKENDNYDEIQAKAEKSDLRCADDDAQIKMKKLIDKTKEEGDSLGGIVEIVALNLPIGLGSFVHWDKRLDGKIAQAIMSIPAIKSVSIGNSDKAALNPGSAFHDEIFPDNEKLFTRKTNNAGGLEGGMTNGSPIVLRAVMKPIPTMKKPLSSINLEGKEHIAHFERADVCAVPAAGVVAEAMLSIILAQAFLEKFGNDSLDEIKNNFNYYQQRYLKK
ncbi:MAG: chorismate synthase [Candidatus Gastranaerophilales bacterium]|nr:chorismate synthase [Candidatus Gastranaerophilales bacterium]